MQKEQVLLYLPAIGRVRFYSLWTAGSTPCAIEERTATHKESRILFKSVGKELTNRSIKPRTVLAGSSSLGGDGKVTFDIILS